MPHQWLEGNLPVSAKCVVCDKNCGSVRRLQDWRCLWCKAIVSGIDGCLVKSVFVIYLFIIWGLCCELESYFQFWEKGEDTSERSLIGISPCFGPSCLMQSIFK